MLSSSNRFIKHLYVLCLLVATGAQGPKLKSILSARLPGIKKNTLSRSEIKTQVKATLSGDHEKPLSSYLRSLFSFLPRHQQTKSSNFVPGSSLLSVFFPLRLQSHDALWKLHHKQNISEETYLLSGTEMRLDENGANTPELSDAPPAEVATLGRDVAGTDRAGRVDLALRGSRLSSPSLRLARTPQAHGARKS